MPVALVLEHQREGFQPAVPRLQPARQPAQQPTQGEQQTIHLVGGRGQGQAAGMTLGRGKPGARVGCLATGPIEQIDGLPGLAPGEAAAGKATHVPQAARPHAGEEFEGSVIEPAAVGQCGQGQGIDGDLQRRAFADQAAGRKTGQPAGCERVGGHSKAAVETELAKTAENGVAKGRQAPEETQAGFDFQQHGGSVQADGGGEACRPAGDLDQGRMLQAQITVDQQQAGG